MERLTEKERNIDGIELNLEEKETYNGVLGKAMPADSTLKNIKKEELIEMLHIAQNNYNVLRVTYQNAVDDNKCNRCPLMQTTKKKRSEVDGN